MFDKLKDLNKLRKAQAEVKKQLESIFTNYDDGEFKIVIRGDKKIERITIDGDESSKLKEALNKAFKELDKKVEKAMKGKLGDFGFPEL